MIIQNVNLTSYPQLDLTHPPFEYILAKSSEEEKPLKSSSTTRDPKLDEAVRKYKNFLKNETRYLEKIPTLLKRFQICSRQSGSEKVICAKEMLKDFIPLAPGSNTGYKIRMPYPERIGWILNFLKELEPIVAVQHNKISPIRHTEFYKYLSAATEGQKTIRTLKKELEDIVNTAEEGEKDKKPCQTSFNQENAPLDVILKKYKNFVMNYARYLKDTNEIPNLLKQYEECLGKSGAERVRCATEMLKNFTPPDPALKPNPKAKIPYSQKIKRIKNFLQELQPFVDKQCDKVKPLNKGKFYEYLSAANEAEKKIGEIEKKLKDIVNGTENTGKKDDEDISKIIVTLGASIGATFTGLFDFIKSIGEALPIPAGI
jgi:exonuclease VII small subunit